MTTDSQLDSLLRDLPRWEPPAKAVERTRAGLANAARTVPEVMTIAEVAAYLRLAPEDLTDLLAELPVFEIAGHLRVRRQRLDRWIHERELHHERELAATAAAEMKGIAV